MKKLGYYALGLLSVLSMLAPTTKTMAAETVSANDYIETVVSSKEDLVTVSVSLAEDSKLTNGRIQIQYDADTMELVDYELDEVADFVDFNEETATYAWVSQEALTDASDLFTVNFKVKNAKHKQQVSVTTNVIEAYQGDEAVALGENITSFVTLRIPTVLTAKNTKLVVNSYIPVSIGNLGIGIDTRVSVTVDNKAKTLSSKDYSYKVLDSKGKVVNSHIIKEAGTYKLSVTGKNDYDGTVTKTFKVTKTPIKVFKWVIGYTWSIKY